ncbi:class I adenylate-forming enzyme family protein [Rhodovulum sp. DZ06]|uniref:class I adenylate-forming enzyme family protein n=1 Tax=Rhodovulum sp. DZ06 TaxID=3425126 RepID=UPI003D328989
MDGSDRAGGAATPGQQAGSGGLADGWMTLAPVAARRELHFGRIMPCAPDRPATLHAMLDAARAANPGADAVAAEEARLTHDALHARAAEIAAGLHALGLRKGDRVAAQIGNKAVFIELFLACMRQGLAMLPLNPRYAPPEIAFAVNDSGAAILVHDAEMAGQLPPEADTPGLRARIAVQDGAPLFAGEGPAPDPDPGEEEDLAVILYTSGTTGKPKGAMLTHFNLVHSCLQFHAGMDIRPGDRTVLSVPASHVTGLVANILAFLTAGCTVVVVRAFKAGPFLEVMERERVTHSLMVPAMYQLCLMDPSFDDRDLSAWRLGGFGGAPMPVPVIEALEARLPTLALQQGYGATETASAVTMMPTHATKSVPNAVGKAMHFSSLAVFDDDGRELPAGEIGEIWIGGPLVIPGYWNRPDANASEFAGGMWKSGDLGRIDARGFVEVLDRKKDMINRGGYKIFSTEVENVLMKSAAVAECAVLGYPCEVLGERVRAVLVLKDGADPAQVQAELEALAAARLADFRRPERWTFRSEPLPRNANGKILKTALRGS